MPSTHDKTVQYLHEAHAMELALVRTLQAHVAMTPAGAYRTELDRHLRETRGHADGIARRLRELDAGPSLVGAGLGLAQRAIGQLLALGKAPLDMVGRGGSPEEKLLKNAKDECATEALEIATYDALEQLASQAGDSATAKLAASHRADEERMLAALREQLPQLTAAVVGAEVRGESSYDAGTTGAAQAARKTRRAAGELAQDAIHDVRSAAGTLGDTQQREEHRSPFPQYDDLTVDEVTGRLDDLTPAQLRHVATYERAHKRRRGVLDAVEQRRVAVG
jgi:ferritin-like metal-binding protein YciE